MRRRAVIGLADGTHLCGYSYGYCPDINAPDIPPQGGNTQGGNTQGANAPRTKARTKANVPPAHTPPTYIGGELVFNTSMCGYQEIMTDPSYSGQIITFTCPHIGNVGVNDEDYESTRIHAAGLVFRNVSPLYSNYRATRSFEEFLIKNKCAAITNVDTRLLTRKLRDHGCQNSCIISFEGGDEEESKAAQQAIEQARRMPAIGSNNLAQLASCGDTQLWQEDLGDWSHSESENNSEKNSEHNSESPSMESPPMESPPMESPSMESPHILVYDCGVKSNILRLLKEQGCKVTLVPYDCKAQDLINQHQADGVLISNGPGDPETCKKVIQDIKFFLQQSIPLLGICLGQQLLGIAVNAKSQKMKFGHHGANHPVRREKDNTVAITSQNHNFTLDEASLPSNIRVTHRSLFDNSIQGIELTDKPAIGFQGHPEASPGPHDITEVFTSFIQLIKQSPLKHNS